MGEYPDLYLWIKYNQTFMTLTFVWQLVNILILGGIIYTIVLLISNSFKSKEKLNKIQKDIEDIKKILSKGD